MAVNLYVRNAMRKLKEFHKDLSRFDRMCALCKTRKPLKGGKVIRNRVTAEKFICGECNERKAG